MNNTTYYYQELLKNELSERIKKNSRYSLRAFARALAVDAGDLSKILSGTKVLTPEISKKVLSNLTLSSQETQDFLFSMAEAYEGKGVKRKNHEIKAILKRPKTQKKAKDLTVDTFKVISDWYHYAILQLVESEGFVNDVNWIAQQLNISPMEVKFALERLTALELIKEDQGTLVRTFDKLTTGDRNLTNAALRKRIKQVSEKSVHALENTPIEKRNHTTMTMSIDPDQIPLAKEMIQDFMDRLEATLQTKKKKVYELQINLFPLQRMTHEN